MLFVIFHFFLSSSRRLLHILKTVEDFRVENEQIGEAMNNFDRNYHCWHFPNYFSIDLKLTPLSLPPRTYSFALHVAVNMKSQEREEDVGGRRARREAEKQ